MRRAYSLASDTRSAIQLGSDFVATRLLRRIGLDRRSTVRSIEAGDGLRVYYRLNSGDLQSIREVLLDECYRLPFDIVPRTVLDLGANIGLTTLWFWRTWRPERIVAVEALRSNAALARRNFEANRVKATLIEAAVGPRDGTCAFAESDASNKGRVLSSGGITVPMVSMQSVFACLPPGCPVDVVKMDIEGGEEALLLEGDTSWIDWVRSFIVEFHPAVIDRPRLVRTLVERQFRYIPPNTVFEDNYEAFVRDSPIRS